MTLDEAIEEQNLYLQHSDQWSHERLDKAIKLGIEALKLLKVIRQDHPKFRPFLLPGETKDEQSEEEDDEEQEFLDRCFYGCD